MRSAAVMTWPPGKKKGTGEAIVAVGRSILVIVWRRLAGCCRTPGN